jgi:hypothetical protein
MWWLWLVLMVAVAGYFIYRADKKIKITFDDKFNPTDWELPRSVELPADIKLQPVAALAPSVKLSYEKKPSVLNETQRHIFNALQQAVAGEYILLTNINAGDVLSVNANTNMLAVQTATKNIAAKQFDFIVCENTQLTPVCAIMLGDSLEPLLVNACEYAQLPLARFKVQANYDASVIRASLLKALGRTDASTAPTYENALEITDAVEAIKPEQKIDIDTEQNSASKADLIDSGIKLELCPECSSVMLKRKAKNGNSAGKLFWICSTYPKCRGMLPVK